MKDEKEKAIERWKLEMQKRKFIRNTTLNVKIAESVEIENGIVKMNGIYIPFINPEECLNPDDFNQ